MPLPPVDSIVNVYETTKPYRSATVRWVVDGPSPASDVVSGSGRSRRAPDDGVGGACSVISARRSAANASDSRQRSGTST